MIFVDPAWARQPGEPPGAYLVFQSYIRTPFPRNASALAREEGKSPQTYSNYCATYHWKERAALWDAYQAESYAARVVDKTENDADAYISNLEKTLKLGMSKIDAMIAAGELPNLRQALKMIFESIRLAREIRMHSEKTLDQRDDRESRAKMDFSDFSEKETEEFIRLLEKGQGSLDGFGPEAN